MDRALRQHTTETVIIHDVAGALGVSVSAKSPVANKKKDVAPEAFQRVKSVIEELGYTSSLAARIMRSRATNVIGLIMPDVHFLSPSRC